MRNGLNESCRDNQNTHFIFNNFFSENRTIYEIMSKNMAEAKGGRSQITSQYGANALHAGKARLHAGTHTQTNK
jgi:hypothetical protein